MYESVSSQYSPIPKKQRNDSYSFINCNFSRKNVFGGGGNSSPFMYHPSFWSGVASIWIEVSLRLLLGYHSFNVFLLRLSALRSPFCSFESWLANIQPGMYVGEHVYWLFLSPRPLLSGIMDTVGAGYRLRPLHHRRYHADTAHAANSVWYYR